MQSVPGLKKCFDFVAGLSKRILGSVPIQSFVSNSQNSQEKSLPDQPNSEQLSIGPHLTHGTRQNVSQNKTSEKPKVICFESYMQNKPNTLKASTIKFLTNNKNSYFKNNQPNPFKQHKVDTYNANSTNTKNISSKIMENIHDGNDKRRNSNENQIHTNVIFYKLAPSTAQIKDSKNISENDSNSQDSESEEVHLGKKDKKIIKKNLKNSPVAQSIQINTNEIIFTYEDGDDISSIAAKSQTTDQIEPQLLSFLSKRGNMCYKKLDEPKFKGIGSFNMKKKSSHHQGETVEVKSPKKKQSQQHKSSQSEFRQNPQPKKRAFQLYPGQTFQQFKKRILVQQQPSSQQDESISNNIFQTNIIKKQQYHKLINHLNNSLSKMQEEKNREASILIVEKMVDESENQQQNSNPSPEKYLDESENYKVWNNAADNPSFKLYFRDA